MFEKIRFCAFWLFAAFIAPFHFKPVNCPVRCVSNCRIWNCEFHYKDGVYSDCQRNIENEREG